MHDTQGLWLLVTGSWPEARSEKPAAKTLTPETRHLTPEIKPCFANYLRDEALRCPVTEIFQDLQPGRPAFFKVELSRK